MKKFRDEILFLAFALAIAGISWLFFNKLGDGAFSIMLTTLIAVLLYSNHRLRSENKKLKEQLVPHESRRDAESAKL